MSSQWKWAGVVLIVVLLAWAVWNVLGKQSGNPSTSEAESSVVEPEASRPTESAEATLADALSGSGDTEVDRVPAGPTAVTGESTHARIAILVLDEESRAPVPAVRVTVMYLTATPRGASNTLTANTDAKGRVELEVDAEKPLIVYASGSSEGSIPVGQADEELEPLAPGERREVTLEVPVGRDLVFFGRVIDETTEAPIPGARAVALRDELEVEADGEGLIELRVPTWNPGAFELRTTGYGPRRFVPNPGHERADGARPLPLLPVATLSVRVLDEGPEPLETLSVRLSVKSWELDMPDESVMTMRTGFSSRPDGSWRAVCSADGTCELTDLPARVPLEAELLRDRGVVLRAGSFGLEPGEVREVQWELNTGVRVVGTVIDQDGGPVAGCAIGRFPSSAAPGSAAERWLLRRHEYDRATETTSSDHNGRFTFADVVPGVWWIGPCPPERSSRGIPAVAERVEVPSGLLEYPIELRVERGSFIRGRVLEPDGSATRDAWMSARGESMSGGTNGKMNGDGSFVVGPLPAGTYRLQARAFGEFAPSREVVARAGDEDVILQLRRAGSIAGQVVGSADGIPRNAEISVCGTGDVWLHMITSTGQEGSFEVSGLEAGAYDLTARSPDGLVGTLRGVVVTPGATSGGQRIDLVRGARVEVRYEGFRDYGSYDIRCGGSVVVFNSLKRGATAVHAVPPGAIEVDHRHGLESVEVQHLELEAGEQGTVVFSKDE